MKITFICDRPNCEALKTMAMVAFNRITESAKQLSQKEDKAKRENIIRSIGKLMLLVVNLADDFSISEIEKPNLEVVYLNTKIDIDFLVEEEMKRIGARTIVVPPITFNKEEN